MKFEKVEISSEAEIKTLELSAGGILSCIEVFFTFSATSAVTSISSCGIGAASSGGFTINVGASALARYLSLFDGRLSGTTRLRAGCSA